VDIRLRLLSDPNPFILCVLFCMCYLYCGRFCCAVCRLCVWAVGQYGKFKRLARLPLIKIDIKLPTYQIGGVSLVPSIYALISPNFRSSLVLPEIPFSFSFNVSLSVHGAR
jgi:hypothetical protein